MAGEAKKTIVGIILGTGMSVEHIVQKFDEHVLDTPFGKPVNNVHYGDIEGTTCVVLTRYSRKYNILPSNINYRANLWAMSMCNCTHIIAVTNVVSLQEHYKPGDIVIPSDYIDFTTKRERTFFDGTVESTIGGCQLKMDPPFNEKLRQLLIDTTNNLEYDVHQKGTIIITEGPNYPTYAEDRFYRQLGGDINSMTISPECILAKELGMVYAVIAIVKCYGPWRREAEIDEPTFIKRTALDNVERVSKILTALVPELKSMDWSDDFATSKKLVAESCIHL